MTEFNDILPEDFENLEKYAPTLAAMDRINPFLVPEGYFDALPGHVRALLSISDAARDRFLGFQLPDRYFEELPAMLRAMALLADASKDRNAGLAEPGNGYFDQLTAQIEQLTALASALGKDGGMETPEGYFDQLNSELGTHLALDNLKQDREHLFSVPDGYFDSLAGRIRSRMAMEQAGEGSDADVPEGYFEQLAARVQARIAAGEQQQPAGREETKVISIFTHVRRNVKTYAAAASLLLVLGIGWVIYHNSGNAGSQTEVVKNDKVNTPGSGIPLPSDTMKEKQEPGNIASEPGREPGNTIGPPQDTTSAPENQLVNQDKKDSVTGPEQVPPPLYVVAEELPPVFDAELKAAAIEYLAANEDDIGALWDEAGMN